MAEAVLAWLQAEGVCQAAALCLPGGGGALRGFKKKKLLYSHSVSGHPLSVLKQPQAAVVMTLNLPAASTHAVALVPAKDVPRLPASPVGVPSSP